MAGIRAVAALALAALVSACGGGGGGGGYGAPPPAPPAAIPDNLAITAPAVAEMSAAAAFTSSAASLSGLSFAWSFGDGASSTEASPQHQYTQPGDFEVSLKVSNSAGTSKEVKAKLAVNNRAITSGLSCSGANQGGWCWQTPRPSGNAVNDAHFVSSSVGWTVGDSGEILKTVDGGKTWARQFAGVSTQLTSVRFADANNGWALGAYGALLRTVDGGARWTMQSADLPQGASTRLVVVNAATAMILAGSNVLAATADGGNSWTRPILDTVSPTITADGVIWDLGSSVLRKSADLGKTWTVLRSFSSFPYGPVLVMQGQSLWIAARALAYDPLLERTVYRVTIQRSTDGGATWGTLTPETLPGNAASMSAIDFNDANVGAVEVNTALYRTTDGGVSWTQTAVPAGAYGLEHRVMAPGVRYRGYFDSSNKRVHQLSEDAGATWRTISTPGRTDSFYDDFQLQRLQRLDGPAWVALSEGELRQSVDGMASWSVVRGSALAQQATAFQSPWFFDAKRGLALSQLGELLETSNGGLDWTARRIGVPAGFWTASRMHFVDATHGWLVTDLGDLFMTTDSGGRWNATPATLTYEFSRVHFLDARNGFATGREVAYPNERRFLTSADGGQTWTALATLAEDIADIHFSNQQQGILVGSGGRIMTTSDGGRTWVNRFSGTSAALNSVARGETGLWVVGDSGTVLNSSDGGATWAPLTVTTASLLKIRFLDTRQGWAVGRNGTILSTQDGGKTWKTQDAGTRAALSDVFFVDSRTGWVSGGYALLATGTGGQ